MNLCEKCGAQVQDGQSFCASCGTKVRQNNSFCPKCGMQLQPGQNFCSHCNGQTDYSVNSNFAENTTQSVRAKKKSKGYTPAFVLGLIGSIFGLFGGICTTACYGFGGNDTVPMIMLIGGSLIGMIGACIGFKIAKAGAVLEITGTLLMAICAFTITGADIMTIVAIAMMGISGIIALIMSFVGD